jgi:hypothetical protein
MFPPFTTALGQAQIDDFHRQAQHDALVTAARRADRHPRKHRAARLVAVVVRWARRPAVAPASASWRPHRRLARQ